LAVSNLIVLVGMARGLEGAWSGSLLDRGVHLLASQKGAVEVLTGSIDSEMASNLAKETDVAESAGELVSLISLADGKTVLAVGWDIERDIYQY